MLSATNVHICFLLPCKKCPAHVAGWSRGPDPRGGGRQRARPHQLYGMTTYRRYVSPPRLARSQRSRWRWT